MKQGFPIARRGMRIGLLGGSFDPAHHGHVHITRQALARFGLDRVWWLVSPGNPLKAHGPAPFGRRMAQARAVMRDPRVEISDVERRLGTRYTFETLTQLRMLYPGVHFVWLMGADNLAQFHRWEEWERIMQLMPIGVLARPESRLTAQRSVAARRFAAARIASERAKSLPLRPPPSWCYVDIPLLETSSTAIRARGVWGASRTRGLTD